MYHHKGVGHAQGPSMNYGAMPGGHQEKVPVDYSKYGAFGGGAPIKPPAVTWYRRRLNVVAMCVCLFVPWLLFCGLYWAISFEMHFWYPGLVYIIMFLGFCFVLFLGSWAWNAFKAERTHDPYYEPTWYIFLFLTCLLAWGLAFYFGGYNFYNYMEAYFGLYNLRAYKGVNPSLAHGQQMMDAGIIEFVSGAHIDFDRAMSFRNQDVYCVAPIVQANNSAHGPPASYDFWAVGINCCCSDDIRTSNFQCGEYANTKANGVVRLMHDDHRDFYRLAVQQAVGSYVIKADHPLFFHWVENPGAVADSYKWEGHRQFLIWMYSFFFLQCMLVLCASCMFNKIEPYPMPINANP